MTKPSSCSLFPVTWSLFAAAMPSREQASRPTKRWLRRNGTSRVPYEKMASPERDKHFVNVIHKGLTVPIDKILRTRRVLRKRGSG